MNIKTPLLALLAICANAPMYNLDKIKPSVYNQYSLAQAKGVVFGPQEGLDAMLAETDAKLARSAANPAFKVYGGVANVRGGKVNMGLLYEELLLKVNPEEADKLMLDLTLGNIGLEDIPLP